ncbi:vegetative cell wall protein gp1-like [Iris pallida]|uniref:Vegetative cell wall protein gp1-like n=1 Tax=Iris pallida TaxID=29817 RepID=A0AAX6IIF9_IRIPA|nr:vegetative cell wall protein gp1-like [Iris pallida]
MHSTESLLQTFTQPTHNFNYLLTAEQQILLLPLNYFSFFPYTQLTSSTTLSSSLISTLKNKGLHSSSSLYWLGNPNPKFFYLPSTIHHSILYKPGPQPLSLKILLLFFSK